jgi:colicin import membrane protein
MARKLRTYRASIGFYDLAVAAPSMKAALEAWGAGSNLFHQGVAKESGDREVVASTMAKPGIVLRRPVGSDGPFREHADLPGHLADQHEPRTHSNKSKKRPAPMLDDANAREAALLFEKEQQRREERRRREEAAEERRHQRRQKAIAKAQSALETSRSKHDKAMAAIEGQRVALERQSEAEATRWEKERRKLEDALREAKLA